MSRRLTTHEAAGMLGAGYPDVLALLRAARVPRERFGGVFLWNADAVRGLKAALQERGLAQEEGGGKDDR